MVSRELENNINMKVAESFNTISWFQAMGLKGGAYVVYVSTPSHGFGEAYSSEDQDGERWRFNTISWFRKPYQWLAASGARFQHHLMVSAS